MCITECSQWKRILLMAVLACVLCSSSVATTYIDVLLVYDTTATDWVEDNGGMATFSASAIAKMNQALGNSSIDCEFRLAHAESASYAHTDLSSDLTALRNGSGNLSSVHTWRDTYRADIVAMFVDTGSSGGYIGRGYLLTSMQGQPNNAFTVNAIRAVENGHVLTHEVGHNLGCHHSKAQGTAPGPNSYLNSYSAGWYFESSGGVDYHTIMAYNFDGTDLYTDPGNSYISAPLFSTPLVSYSGGTAGDAADGDNSRTIRDTMAVVAGYRADANQPTVGVLGDSPDPVREGYEFTLTASGVSDSDGYITRVEFYRDSNGNGQLDVGTDQYLGEDTHAPNWTCTRNATFSLGMHRYFARARDDLGNWSEAKSTIGFVISSSAVLGNKISIDAHHWDDDSGNGDDDGVLETGEDVSLQVRLESSVGLDWIMGTLSSSLGNMDFSDNEVQYPPVIAGGEVWPYGDFNMFLDLASTYSVPFNLHVEYSYGAQDYYQDFSFSKTFYENGSMDASFEVVSYTIDDSTAQAPYNNGDGIIQSGEHVEIRPKLKNSGQSGATDLDAWLTYSGAAFTVDGASDTEGYPDLSPGQEEYPSGGSDYDIRDIRKDVTGTEYIEFHLTYDQSPSEVVLPNAIAVSIQPAAWLDVSNEDYDFGVATPASTVTHTSLVHNAGSTSLQLTNVWTSSSDTTWSGFSLPCSLAAGQSTGIVVQIDTTSLQGQIQRTVSVYGDGRVRSPGEDDQININGLVSVSVPVSTPPGVTGASHPDISGRRIVWADASSGNWDIYCFDVDSETEMQITTNTAHQQNPFIAGSLVVWRDYRNDTGNENSDVYAYDLDHPEFGRFPVANDSPAAELVVGVSGNLVAVRRVYEILYSDQSPEEVWNLLVFEYDGSGGFSQRYSSNYAPGSGTANRETINTDGDFAEGFLMYGRQTMAWYVSSSTGRSRWDPLASYTHAIDFAAGDTGPRNLPYINLTVKCSAAHRFFYRGEPGSDKELWRWKTDGSNQKLYGVDGEDICDDVLAAAGPDGQELICFDYRGRDGLYYIDRGNGNAEAAITTEGDCGELRCDDKGYVWIDYSAGSAVKYAYLKQSDVQVTSPGIAFSDENPVEGSGIDISVLVRNLTSYNQTGDITVDLYDGDPDAGGTSLVTGQGFSGLNASTDRTVVFSNVTTLVEGPRLVFAKLTVTTSDPLSNNKASRALAVQDSDLLPPTISGLGAFEVAGDGDGVLGADENVRISWSLTDASGIGSTLINVDGSNATVQGAYYADLGMLTVGTHSVTVTATDADISVESRETALEFSVVPCEVITVAYGPASVSNGPVSTVDLGLYSASVPPENAIFTVRNTGEQRLDIGLLTVAGDIAKSDPPTDVVSPGNLTSFELIAETSTEGVFTGTVSLVNSDTTQSPFQFRAVYEVRNDTDGDDVPDVWELAYFPGLDTVTTNSDYDEDHSLDKDERIAGTCPTNRNDYFHIADCLMVGTPSRNAVIAWDSVTGRWYRVHTSTSLLGLWSNVVDRAGTGESMSHTNDLPSLDGRFFRLDVRLEE